MDLRKLRAFWRASAALFLSLFVWALTACNGSDTSTPPATYTVGGLVTGLNGSLVLNNGNSAVVVAQDGAFVFDAHLTNHQTFDVEVGVQPVDQTCTVANGVGQIDSANYASVAVTCVHGSGAVTYAVGGSVSGLDQGSVTLLLNNSEALSVSSNGGFSFPIGLPDGQAYFVTVASQPSDAICSVNNAAGTLNGSDVSSVAIQCVSANAQLSSLEVSAGQLSPAFDPNVSAYTDRVGLASSTLELTLVPAHTDSAILVNGFPAVNGVPTLPIPLDLGPNLVTIQVTAASGNTKSYEVVVDRATVFTYAKADAPAMGDGFGSSVASQGDTFVVGSPNEQGSGAVYVFRRTGPTWAEEAHLFASNGNSGYAFGQAVAIDGDTIVVGAPGEASSATGIGGDQLDTMAPGSGSVYVFKRTGTSWEQEAYVKASNTGPSDAFGSSVSINVDTVVVGAPGEASSSVGINGNQGDNSAIASGAAYVFTRSGVTWTQQAYIKASNTGAGDAFGTSVSVATDTLAVGAPAEASSSTGINGNQTSNASLDSGAVFTFLRTGGVWAQQAYIKASNTNASQSFGRSVSLSGSTLAVGAEGEASAAKGVNGDQADTSLASAGAAYVFLVNGGVWTQQAYIKASNTDAGDLFGHSVAIELDTLIVGAPGEASSATGNNGNEADNSAPMAGAVYEFARTGTSWQQQSYVKASNTNAGDAFGVCVAVGESTLAVGATGEASSAPGLDGDEGDNSVAGAGAVYVTP